MNNLQKEVSSYLLNDNQVERAINTLLIEILKPVERAIEQQNWNSGADGEKLDPKIHARSLFIFILLRQMNGLGIMSTEGIDDEEALKELKELREYLEEVKLQAEEQIKEVDFCIKDL